MKKSMWAGSLVGCYIFLLAFYLVRPAHAAGLDVAAQDESSPESVTLTVNIDGQGIVALDPPGGTYEPGTAVTLTATAADGWAFTGWQAFNPGAGQVAYSPSVILINLTASEVVNASFIEAVGLHYPLADAFTDLDEPDALHGEDLLLPLRGRVQSECTAETMLWFKMALPRTQKTINTAIFSLFQEEGAENTNLDVELLASEEITWDEALLTWNNQPTLNPGVLARRSSVPPGSDILFFSNDLTGYLDSHRGRVVTLAVRADCSGMVSDQAEREVRSLEHNDYSGVELAMWAPSAVEGVEMKAHSRQHARYNPTWLALSAVSLISILLAFSGAKQFN